MGSKDLALPMLLDLLRQFRPYIPPNAGRVWHDQIKGFLYMVGVCVGNQPIAEYPVPSPYKRQGQGRIDMVWVHATDSAEEAHATAAFEIDSGIKPGSVRKLIDFPAPWKFILSAGPKATKLKLLGSERLAWSPDIQHVVIEPTENASVSHASAWEALDRLIEIEHIDEHEPKPTFLEVD